MTDRNLTAIDLFCGAGGLSEGFRQAGFHVLAGQDYDEKAGATWVAPAPETVWEALDAPVVSRLRAGLHRQRRAR